jgi:peptidoglycan/LPS O-acetylase OafA/YrhL
MSERDLRLDGLRGLATIFVVVSHFLAEVPSGITGLALGFVAVCMFFVLSGFLIGRLILEQSSSSNFFKVFYARRFLRTLPSYAVVLGAIMAVTAFSGLEWVPGLGSIPAFSYVTFTQNLFFAGELEIGSEWLAPTWTLAVEEQFYLIAPLAIIWTPRRYLLPVIAGVIAASIVYRFNLALQGKHALTYLPTLLGNADALAMGIGAAVLSREIRPNRIVDRLLEIAPLACLGSIIVASAFIPEDMPIALFMRPVIALASAAFILRIAMNAQVSTWLKAPFLCTTGHNSYSIYLVHMPIAGIVHGLITGLHPDIGSASQNFATALSFPATMLVALALTKAVEDPATRLGRSFRWNSPPSRPAKPVLDAAPQPQTPSAAQAGTA